VVRELEAEAPGDGVLPLLDSLVGEFFHPPAVLTDDVVVVLALVELEHGRTALEAVTGHEARRLELREDAIHGGQPDVLV